MLTKLAPEVLDKFDIFVLEVEELFVPKVKSTISLFIWSYTNF